MTASATFPAEAASVPAARRFVQGTLEQLGLGAAWDAAAMLVSELATNAVLHAGTAFTVHVVAGGEVVRVSVSDGSPAVPRQRAYGTDATTGRGLRLIASLAVAWGVERGPFGKTVWFEVLVGGDGDAVVEPWELDTDPDALLAGFPDLADGDGAGRAAGSPSGRAAA